MHRKFPSLLAAVAAAGALALGFAPAAGASVSPTVTYTQAGVNGVAGYYSAPNANRTADGDRVTGVKAAFVLSAAQEYNNSNPADLGVELCQYKALSSTGGVATTGSGPAITAAEASPGFAQPEATTQSCPYFAAS